jgi:hypothetical protein
VLADCSRLSPGSILSVFEPQRLHPVYLEEGLKRSLRRSTCPLRIQLFDHRAFENAGRLGAPFASPAGLSAVGLAGFGKYTLSPGGGTKSHFAESEKNAAEIRVVGNMRKKQGVVHLYTLSMLYSEK